MINSINECRQAAVIALVITCALGVVAIARADHMVIAAQSDATIYEEDGATANGVGALWSGRTSGKLATTIRRALLSFNVDGMLPAEAKIDSVVLRMTMTKANGLSPTSTFDLHRIQANWSEGATPPVGGQGGSAQNGDVTWTHRVYNSDTWSVAGGDIAALADAFVDISTELGENLFTSTTMAATVQDWLDSAASNNGWLIKVRDENTSQTARRFDSRESLTGAPSLEIWYTPKVPVEATSWGGVKSRYAQ